MTITPFEIVAWRRVEEAIAIECKALCKQGCDNPDCHCRADLHADFRREALANIIRRSRAAA